MNEQFFNKHYIRIDSNNLIIAGFSDAFQQPQPTDILINNQGGYQFRLSPDGEENPPLFDDWMIPMYRWNGSYVIERIPEEMEADRPAPAPPIPTQEERISALESVILASETLLDTPMAVNFFETQIKLGRMKLEDVPLKHINEVKLSL